MYDGELVSFGGDFLDYLGLEDMGVFACHGTNEVTEETLARIRSPGKAL